jgi:hypothetical protein
MHYMKGYAQLVFNWVTRILRWLLRAWLAVFAVAIVGVAIAISLLLHTEPAIRVAGLFLQLLGLAAAALGIRDTRRMFGKPSFLQSIRNWVSSWPRFKPKPQYVNLSGSASIGSSASATVWHGAGSGASIEKRVDAIEANLREVEGRVRTAESNISTNERAFKGMLHQEAEERAAQDQILHGKIEAASTDGLRLAAAGAFWLAVGVVLSTASPELLAWSM